MTSRSVGRLALGLVLLVGLSACGGSTGPDPVTPTPMPSLARFVLLQGPWPALDPGDFALADITFSTPGVGQATLNWTFASNRVSVVIFSGLTCTQDDFVAFITNGSAAACTPLGSTLASTTKPAVVTFNIAQAQGARVYVVNFGPTAESGTLLLTLQR